VKQSRHAENGFVANESKTFRSEAFLCWLTKRKSVLTSLWWNIHGVSLMALGGVCNFRVLRKYASRKTSLIRVSWNYRPNRPNLTERVKHIALLIGRGWIPWRFPLWIEVVYPQPVRCTGVAPHPVCLGERRGLLWAVARGADLFAAPFQTERELLSDCVCQSDAAVRDSRED